MSLEFPRHIRKLPNGARGSAETKFKLMIVALYGTPQGTFLALAEKLGCHHTQVSYWIAIQRIPKDKAEAMEKLVGREIAPKEWLAPLDFAETL